MSKTNWARIRNWILLTPLGVASFLLVGELWLDWVPALENQLALGLLPFGVVAAVGSWVGVRRFPGLGLSPVLVVAMVPCVCAPLGVAAPWAIVPGHLGTSYGGFSFFGHWLTKYPNFGPINYEVLAGIVCLLGASIFPVVFAAHCLPPTVPKRRVLAALLFLHLLAYVPVLIRLDLAQLVYGVVVLNMGPQTIVGEAATPLLTRIGLAGMSAGAIVRMAATGGMGVAFFQFFRVRPTVSVREEG